MDTIINPALILREADLPSTEYWLDKVEKYELNIIRGIKWGGPAIRQD